MEVTLGETKLLRITEPLYEVQHTSDFTGKGTRAVKLALANVSSTAQSTSFPNSQSIVVPTVTSAERNALTEVDGMVIYNDTTNRFEFYQNGA